MYGVDGSKPGAQAYYDSIFQLYASWGVDFVKVDDICNTNMYKDRPYSAAQEIEMIASAIRSCGRDMVLSLSPGPAVIEEAWHMEQFANMWRMTDDFWDRWICWKTCSAAARCGRRMWAPAAGRTATCCRWARSASASAARA